jgi:RNA polymerase sigma-70 factor (ECF subfamily)
MNPSPNTNLCKENTFESIFKKYAKDLRRFMFFKTQDVDKAEDIMQDAFVKLWDNCKNVTVDKAKSFLFTVANNMFLNQVSHEKVKRNYAKSVTETASEESPEFVYIEKEFLEKINSAIASLPEKQREVFVMSKIEKKKYKEIAEILDLSIKAVEKRMHQALVVMREKIGNI